MKFNFAELLKSGTFWTAISGIIATIGAGFMGQLSWATVGTNVLLALIGIFLKNGQISQNEEVKKLYAASRKC